LNRLHKQRKNEQGTLNLVTDKLKKFGMENITQETKSICHFLIFCYW